MRVWRETWTAWESEAEASLTIGVFDGVHRGHRALISHLDDELVKTVLTFDPHPVEVLRPGAPPRLITTIEERVALLETAGIDQVGVLDLAEIKELAPYDFVVEVLVKRVQVRHLVIGPDFRFGRNRTGDVSLLVDMGRRHGFDVEMVDLVSDEGGPVSSSRIRTMIESGQVSEAARHLGSRFRLTGQVIHGDKRGAAIGYPTANLAPPPRKIIPRDGVYAAFAHVGGLVKKAAVNVGRRPTFGGGELLVEAYIMDFDRQIYGEQITVEFVEYLREELDFAQVDDLIEQMGEDVAESARVLESAAPNVG